MGNLLEILVSTSHHPKRTSEKAIQCNMNVISQSTIDLKGTDRGIEGKSQEDPKSQDRTENDKFESINDVSQKLVTAATAGEEPKSQKEPKSQDRKADDTFNSINDASLNFVVAITAGEKENSNESQGAALPITQLNESVNTISNINNAVISQVEPNSLSPDGLKLEKKEEISPGYNLPEISSAKSDPIESNTSGISDNPTIITPSVELLPDAVIIPNLNQSMSPAHNAQASVLGMDHASAHILGESVTSSNDGKTNLTILEKLEIVTAEEQQLDSNPSILLSDYIFQRYGKTMGSSIILHLTQLRELLFGENTALFASELVRAGKHYGITCLCCNLQDFQDYRYRCLMCGCNLCGHCFEIRDERKSHKSSHPMLLIEMPLHQNINQLLEDSLKSNLQTLNAELSTVINHSRKCDGCKQTIKGILFKCDDCQCVNLCF